MMKKIASFLLILFLAEATMAQNYLTELNDRKLVVQPIVDIKAYPFNLSDVRLLEGPFLQAMRADATYLLKLDADRLLSSFRSNAGLQAKAKKYGGWESEGLAGHTLGHYLSALSMYYAYSKDEAYLKRVNYIIEELAECQRARKTGYIGAIPNEDKLWADVSKGNIRSGGFDLNGAWSPWYTVHKVMAGLQDAYLYTNNQKALSVNQALANWVGETLKNLDESQIQKMLICEYGGMSETLVNTYAFTGEKKYLNLSYKFYDKRILDTLANQKDRLAGKHSNTQIPKIIASARRYVLTKDAKDLAIANFFWNTVVNHHTYANGGNSDYEYLSEPGKLTNHLTDNTTETCNTYNMLKLTRHLFALSPKSSYFDYYEKALYNHILASQNHDNGMTCYFVPLRMGGKKEFSDEFNTFTCCVGSGMENHVKYNESIYFKGRDGSLYVNLFIPSVLNWKDKRIIVKQETAIPASHLSRISITVAKASRFKVRIRKPHWERGFKITVNRKIYEPTINEEGYAVLDRIWKDGDEIEVTVNADLYTESLPDNPNRKAIFYGPILLAGNLGRTEPDPLKGIPVFVSSSSDANQWLTRVDQDKLIFKTKNLARPVEVEMSPFNQVTEHYYSVYWDVFNPQTWEIQQRVYEEARLKEQALHAKTTDIFRPGEMQPERDHKLVGEKMQTGEDHLKKWRSAAEGGYLSFQMELAENEVHNLVLTYWGMDNRARKFDILVNETKIATEDLNKYKESKFYQISYPIPTELTKGKKIITLKLVPKPGNSAGPFYEAKLIKN